MSELPNSLCTGDIIVLAAAGGKGPGGSLLSAQGSIGSAPYVLEYDDPAAIEDIRDHLFKVVFRCSYNANKDLARAIKQGESEEILAPLREKVTAEQIQNEEQMKEQVPIRYGDVIQLLHVKSNKFIRVQPRQTAPTERRARAVVLSQGNTYAAFTIKPFYKYKYQGEPVLFDQQLLLTVSKLGTQWLLHTRTDHVLKGSTDTRRLHELNCSTDVNGFFPIRYSRDDGETLNFSSTIRIFHTQNERLLGASSYTNKLGSCAQRKPDNPQGPKRPFLRALNENNVESAGNLWGKGIWLLEAMDVLQGGTVKWGAPMRIKHLGTNQYLAVDLETKMHGRCLTQLQKESDGNCVFSFDQVEVDEEEEVKLSRGNFKALIKHEPEEGDPMWLTCFADKLKIKDDQREKPSLELYFNEQRRIRETLQVTCMDMNRPEFIVDINTILMFRQVFVESADKFSSDITIKKQDTMIDDPDSSDNIFKVEDAKQAKMDLFQRINDNVSASIVMLTGEDLESLGGDALKCSPFSVIKMQTLSKSLKHVDAGVLLFKTLWENGYKIDKLTGKTEFDLGVGNEVRKAYSKFELEFGLHEIEWRALRLLVEFWRVAFQDSRECENYFDKNGWVKLVNSINGLGLGAAEVLSEMTNNNVNIASQIDVNMMQTFADFIGDLGPEPTWLVFMRSVCSCDGSAISKNQELILRMMYDPGPLASKEEKDKWGLNRTRLLTSLQVGDLVASFPTLPQHIVEANFLGKSTMVDSGRGLCDILVSWDTREDLMWANFKEWIYYHPNHLTLPIKHTTKERGETRWWVSCASISWTLCPQYLYSMVHPDEGSDAWAQKGEEIKETGRFGALLILSEYILAQVLLMSEMCLDRQINCINNIGNTYTFEMISYAMWNPALPPQLRGAFCQLFQNLWLDRPPHAQVCLPQLVYKWPALEKLPYIPVFELPADQQARGGTAANGEEECAFLPTKFNLMIAYCCSHFAQLQGRMVYGLIGHCQQTGAAADLIKELFFFGFVSSYKTLCVIISLTLRTLDGRTDWLEIADAKVADGESPAREETDNDPLLNNKGIFSCCSGAGNAGDGGEAGGSGAPLYYGIPGDEDEKLRYDCHELVVDSKLKLGSVLTKILEIVQNDDLQTILAVFHRTSSKDDQTSDQIAKEVLESLAETRFNFDKLANTSLNTALVDMMMYKDSELFRCAIAGIWALNHRVRQAIASMENITMLIRTDEMAIYDNMKSDVARLENLFSSFEDWGVATSYSERGDESYREVNGICERLRHLCSEGGPGNDHDLPDAKHQDMLKNLGLGEVAMYAYKLPVSELKGQTKVLMLDMMNMVCKMVVQYVNDNPRNQKELFEKLDEFMAWFGAGAGVANVIAGIFVENIELCEQLPTEIIFQFGRTITQSQEAGGGGFLPRQLNFLRACLVVGGHPVLRNKGIIVDLLKNPSFAEVLLLTQSDEEGEGASEACRLKAARRNTLLREFRSYAELEKPTLFRSFMGGDAEIQYHSVSLDLLGTLCIGRDRTGCTEFVQFLASARSLAAGYIEVTRIQTLEKDKTMAEGKNPDAIAMCKSLKKSMLYLLANAYYDTELVDTAFLSSAIHVQVVESIIEEMEADCPDLENAELNEVSEQFMFQALGMLNSLLEYTDHKFWAEGLEDVLNDTLRPLLVKLGDGDQYRVQHHSQTLFKNTVNRCLGWIDDDDTKKNTRLVDLASERRPTQQFTEADKQAMALADSLKEFTEDLSNNLIIKTKICEEHCHMIQHISNIGDLTNLANPEYKAHKKARQKAGREMDMDFRRNQVKLDDFVKRAVDYCLHGDNIKNWEITELVFQTISDMLLNVKDPALLLSVEEKVGSDIEPVDIDAFVDAQVRFARQGCVNLVVQTMMLKPDTGMVNEALQMAILLMEPRNEEVQQVFQSVFYTIDDSGLWEVLLGVYAEVETSVKGVRGLKATQRASGDDLMTEDEIALIDAFNEDLKVAARAMYMQKLFCEGHNRKMQEYIFRQVDNTSSYNFVEKSVNLLLKLCKNENASDSVDPTEIECFLQIADLLLEVTTGPDPRNQEFLSVSGMVEGLQKIGAGKFKLLRAEEEGDCYPEQARSAKARITNCALAMLELRPDLDVHNNVIFRLDGYKIKQRLIFVHRWFISKFVTDWSTKPQSPAHIAGEDGICNLDDDDAMNDGIEVPDGPPEALVSDFDEDDLTVMFEEAFSLMMIKRELEPYNEKFKESVSALSTSFTDDPSLFVSHGAYVAAKTEAERIKMFKAAFDFFDRWINTIEVTIENKVYEVHFRMPVTCDFVLGQTKTDIEQSVDIETPDDKIRGFVEMCDAAYSQTLHTLALSKWSPSVLKCMKKPPQPLNFFLQNDSKNLSLIPWLCLYLSFSLNTCLLAGLELHGPSGERLLADSGGRLLEEDTKDHVVDFTYYDMELAVMLQGILYAVMKFTALCVVCTTYSPLDYADCASACAGNSARWPETLAGLVLASIAFVGPFLQGKAVLGAVLAVFILIQIGGTFSGWGAKCPNNFIAKFLATVSKGAGRQDISRRVIFTGLAVLGVVHKPYWFTFLLLDILFLSPMLQNVVKAVSVPIDSLTLTAVVGVIVMYEYAVVAFYYFRHDYEGTCQGVIDCTLTTIYQGLRMDIGSAVKATHVFDGNWYPRMAFDLSYFVVITTILMNVIFGIILDQFGSLRDETSSRITYFKNFTFIACIDRSAIEEVALAKGVHNGWDYLEKYPHGKQNRWKYLNFIFYLRTKDPTELSGVESMIADLVEEGEVSWMPLGTCGLMQDSGGGGDEGGKDISAVEKELSSLKELHEQLVEKVDELNEKVVEKGEEPEEAAA